MKRADNRFQPLGRWLIARETLGADEAALAAGIDRALSRLDELFCVYVGQVGFRALLERAAHLRRGDWPWLGRTGISASATLLIRGPVNSEPEAARAQVSARVHLDALPEAIAREGRDTVLEAASALVGTVLELLSNFIGEDLTMRLVRRVWPDVPSPSSDSGAHEA